MGHTRSYKTCIVVCPLYVRNVAAVYSVECCGSLVWDVDVFSVECVSASGAIKR